MSEAVPVSVTQAVRSRKSIRAFLDTPVSDETIAGLLETAARAPSGGNVQPWRIYVVGSATMPSFLEFIGERPPETPEYEVYPPKLWEPYRTNRFELGEDMYALLEIERDDRAGRLARMAENFKLFGAPASIFCFIDKKMGPPQWSDLGMFLQTFMLLATEAGLDTCAQEAWSSYPQGVKEFVGAPDDEMLFCGVAIGHADTTAPVNSLESKRMPLEQWTTFIEPKEG